MCNHEKFTTQEKVFLKPLFSKYSQTSPMTPLQWFLRRPVTSADEFTQKPTLTKKSSWPGTNLSQRRRLCFFKRRRSFRATSTCPYILRIWVRSCHVVRGDQETTYFPALNLENFSWESSFLRQGGGYYHSENLKKFAGLLFLCAVFNVTQRAKSVREAVGADVTKLYADCRSDAFFDRTLANSHNKGILFPSPHREAVFSILHRLCHVNTSLHLSHQSH